VISKSDLSRAAIVERALDIADTEGLDAITIRRISKEFGVTPMALYWHVQNKDELLEAMGDALFADLVPDVDAELPWPEQLRTLVERLVAALRAHPGAVQLAFRRVLVTDPGLQIAEAVFELLRSAGFSVRETASVGTHAMRTAIMLVVDEPGRAFAGTEQEREDVLATKRAHFAALPADRFPRLHEAADVLLDCDDEDDYYRFGVDLYVSGVTRLAEAAALASG
jgi:AcrR family transcriptional regulator